MNKLATLVIILATSACATTRTMPTLALDSAPAGTLDLTLAPDGVSRDALVLVSEPALPTANRMRRALIRATVTPR